MNSEKVGVLTVTRCDSKSAVSFHVGHELKRLKTFDRIHVVVKLAHVLPNISVLSHLFSVLIETLDDETHPHVLSLEVHSLELKDSVLGALIDALAGKNESVHMDGIAIFNAVLVSREIQCLTRFQRLLRLTLSGIGLDDDGLKIMLSGHGWSLLMELDLTRNLLGNEAASMLSKAWGTTLAKLRTLKLSYNRVEDKGAILLAQQLVFTMLEKVEFTHNSYTNASLPTFVLLCRQCQTLRHLKVSRLIGGTIMTHDEPSVNWLLRDPHRLDAYQIIILLLSFGESVFPLDIVVRLLHMSGTLLDFHQLPW